MRFLKEKIFVTAPSDSISTNSDRLRLSNAIKIFNNNGYAVELGQTVNMINSYTKDEYTVKAKELEDAILNKEIDVIISANGGNSIINLIPYINFEKLKNVDEKIIQGFSDNAVLLFLFTTLLGWKSYYAPCFPTFGFNNWDTTITNNFEMLKGNIVKQNSSPYYESKSLKKVIGKELYGYNLDTKNTIYELNNIQKFTASGTMLGGCLDVIRDIVGTKFDYVENFNDKNKDIIWYIENCAMNLEELNHCLQAMIDHNWFNNVRCFMIGRGKITLDNDFLQKQNQLLKEKLEKFKVPILINCDFGHLRPFITIINGSHGNLIYINGKYEIQQKI